MYKGTEGGDSHVEGMAYDKHQDSQQRSNVLDLGGYGPKLIDGDSETRGDHTQSHEADVAEDVPYIENCAEEIESSHAKSRQNPSFLVTEQKDQNGRNHGRP